MSAVHTPPPSPAAAWSPTSWRGRPWAWAVHYEDHGAVDAAVERLRQLPPLVTSGEIERLREQIGEAQEGRRFLLQGGDCAERTLDCTPDVITRKLKIILQMSLALMYAGKKPVVRVGRWAGQYSKPRSSGHETRTIDGQPMTLPSYFGDLVNRPEFTPEARRADPALMIEGYKHAALTLNFIRALLDAGFADVHHPERWDLGFLKHAGLTPETRDRYQMLMGRIGDGIRFMEALGERTVEDLSSPEFFASHEALNLYYEEAQTRQVPRRTGWYNLTTHLPWVGERTRALDGPHIEYLRGIRNPVGVKLGPATTVEQVVALLRTINPAGEPGKVVLIPRLGAANVRRVLPGLIHGARLAGSPVLWSCDPMHGNAATTPGGVKTRNFADVLSEILTSWDVHAESGTALGGVHIELTGDDVTECLGGAANLTEKDLSRNYATLCDPRLNYEQSLELAFALAQRMEA
ncbi:MAG: 3-deoxy-7-phosphoheptulonate synthase class II [Phycisphaerales bacterium]